MAAKERIQFADGRSDDMPVEMAEAMLRDIFRRRRRVFADAARTYYLGLPGGQADEADEGKQE